MPSKTNLHAASHEWANRPADERFWTVDEMLAATKKTDESRETIMVPTSDIAVEPHGRSIRIKTGAIAKPTVFNNWSFRQLCHRAGVPSDYVMSLSHNPKLAAACVNDGLQKNKPAADDRAVRVSVIRNGTVEAFTSDRYAFIPNWRICEGLRVLEGLGWRSAPARPSGKDDARARKATKDDVLKNNKGENVGIAVKVGDMIAPAGLYASDRDMFAFLVHEGNAIDDGSGGAGLNRGVFITNSEVGANAFKITTFLYDAVCGNHIVWGASEIGTIRVRHVGDAQPKVFAAMGTSLEGYLRADGGLITKSLKRARMIELGRDKEEVIEEILSRRRVYAQRAYIHQAWDLCEKLDSSRAKPNTLWGQVVGLTRLSQMEQNTNERMRIDDVARRLLATVN